MQGNLFLTRIAAMLRALPDDELVALLPDDKLVVELVRPRKSVDPDTAQADDAAVLGSLDAGPLNIAEIEVVCRDIDPTINRLRATSAIQRVRRAGKVVANGNNKGTKYQLAGWAEPQEGG